MEFALKLNPKSPSGADDFVVFEVEEVDVALLVVVVDDVTLLVELELELKVDGPEVEVVPVVFDLEPAPENAKYAPPAMTITTTSAMAAMV